MTHPPEQRNDVGFGKSNFTAMRSSRASAHRIPNLFSYLVVAALLAGAWRGVALESPFAPGVLDRIECDVTTWKQGETKKTIILAPGESLVITDSKFPNGQDFAFAPLLSGTLNLNFPPKTTTNDLNTGYPPMSASASFVGTWTRPPAGEFAYGAARLTMGSIGNNFGTCPSPPRVEVPQPITPGAHAVSISSSCDQIKSLSGLSSNDPMISEAFIPVYFDAITGDGQNGSAIFLGVEGTVNARAVYKAERRATIQMATPILQFNYKDGEALPGPQTLIITNAGKLQLVWKAKVETTPAGGAWLKVQPEGGTLQSLDRDALEVSVSPAGLAPGEHNGTVTVYSDEDYYGGPKSFNVKLKVTGTPKLTVAPSSLEFFNRVAIPEQILTLKNEGTAALVWQAVPTSTGNWLNPQYKSNQLLPGATEELRIRAFVFFPDPPLDPGDYTGQIVFQPFPGQPPELDFPPPPPVTAIFHVLAPADELSINANSVAPLTKDPLKLNTDYDNFRVDVTYQLGSRSEADLALRLFDETGVLQASSDFIKITRVEGRNTSRRLTLNKFKLVPDPEGNTPGKLFLRAVILDRQLLTSILVTPENDYVYKVGKADLIALEVTQVVQDWNLSVPLFEGKQTIVRAHILSNGTEPVPIKNAKLFGTRAGESLGPGLEPSNPGHLLKAARIKSESKLAREDRTSSLNFTLPLDWCKEDVQLYLDAPGVLCKEKEKNGGPDDCTVTVKFLPAPAIQIKFVEVHWFEFVDGHRVDHAAPTDDRIEEEAKKILSVYPINRLKKERDYIIGPLGLAANQTPDVDTVLSELHEVRKIDNCQDKCGRIYYAVIGEMPALRTGGNLGKGDFFTPIACGADCGGLADDSSTRHLASHEIGHVLGRPHPINESNGTANNQKHGWCGEVADLDAENFPWTAVIGAHTVPTLGPLDPNDAQFTSYDLVFGYDTLTSRVVNPLKIYELMSYCGNIGRSYEWPSKHTYEELATALKSRAAFAAGRPRPQGPLGDYLVISGSVLIPDDTAEIRPFNSLYHVETPEAPPPGEYQLVLRNGSGQELQVVEFAPDVPVAETEVSASQRGIFTLTVPANLAYREALIRRAGKVLASRLASPNAPTVQVLFPNGGENITTDPVELKWQGSDADGDPLVYTVQFSPDGGGSWETLVLKQPVVTYPLPLKYLKGTTQGLIRVIASDGFNTAVDVSNAAFTIPNRPPQVKILSPSPGRLFIGSELVELRAEVSDAEDVDVPDDKIEWRSNVDGLLGTGPSLQRFANTLTEGTHTLTVKATDGNGLDTSATMSIQVLRVAPEKLSDLEVTSALPGGLSAYTAFTFPVTVANHGPTDASGVNVTVTLPAGMKFVSAQPSQGAVQVNGQEITGNLGALTAFATATIEMTVVPKSSGAQTIHSVATAVELDPDPSNNSLDRVVQIAPSSVPVGPLVADYQFANVLTSAVAGAPPLGNLGDGNTFAVEAVDGAERPVLHFLQGDGVVMPGFSDLVPSNHWSIVVLFRFDAVNGYRRLLDLKNGLDDRGCYVSSGQLFFFLFNSVGSAATIEPNKWAQVVITRASDNTVMGYHDGALRLTFKDDANVMIPDAANSLRFFRDNGDEESAGEVARIRLYDRVLSAEEVANLDRLPLPPGPLLVSTERVGDKIVISWPAAAAGFVLQSNIDVTSPAGWSEVPAVPTIQNGVKSVAIAPLDSIRFFRLIRQP
jgi:uncharacterized repeat protein (TIGR01451 family)